MDIAQLIWINTIVLVGIVMLVLVFLFAISRELRKTAEAVGRVEDTARDICRPHVLGKELEAGYQQMAQDEEHEAEALEWAEATVGDVGDEEKWKLRILQTGSQRWR